MKILIALVAMAMVMVGLAPATFANGGGQNWHDDWNKSASGTVWSGFGGVGMTTGPDPIVEGESWSAISGSTVDSPWIEGGSGAWGDSFSRLNGPGGGSVSTGIATNAGGEFGLTQGRKYSNGSYETNAVALGTGDGYATGRNTQVTIVSRSSANSFGGFEASIGDRPQVGAGSSASSETVGSAYARDPRNASAGVSTSASISIDTRTENNMGGPRPRN